MNNILASNLACIRQINPILADKILGHDTLDGHYELKEADSGAALLYRNGKSIHDKIDPEQEAIDILNNIQNKTKMCINVIFGLGIGYLFKRFAKSAKGKIIVYEPNLDILRVTLELVDFTPELSRKDVIIVNNKEDVYKAYEKLFCLNYKLNFSFLNYYKYMLPEEFNQAIKDIGDIQSIYQSNYNDYLKKTGLWTQCNLRNAFYPAENHDLSVLKNKFEGKTAVIISAGPSLIKNIELVKENRDKFCVFCVGTALKTVIQYEIMPDFVVQLEYFTQAYYQLKNFDLSNTNLILQPVTNTEIHKLKAKNKFYFYPTNDHVAKWMADLWEIDSSAYKNMGTVSICALISAKILGFKNLILIGQDLAYTGGECYAKGSTYDDYKVTVNKDDLSNCSFECNKDNKTDICLDVLNKKNNLLFPVKGQIENTVYAPSDYVLFIKYFEQLANEWGDSVKLINATEGGAYIEGLEHIPLKEAINKYTDSVVDVESQLNTLLPLESFIINKRKKIMLKELITLSKITKQVLNAFIYEATNWPDEEIKPIIKGLCKPKELAEEIHIEKVHIDRLYKFYKHVYKKTINIIKLSPLLLTTFFVAFQGVEDAFVIFDKKDYETYENVVIKLSWYYYALPYYMQNLDPKLTESIALFNENLVKQ